MVEVVGFFGLFVGFFGLVCGFDTLGELVVEFVDGDTIEGQVLVFVSES